MVIGGNKKLCVILSYNNAGTAALCLVRLCPSKEIPLLDGHGICNRYNRRHGLLHNRGNIRYSGNCGCVSAARHSIWRRFLSLCCSLRLFLYISRDSCHIHQSGTCIINACHHTAGYRAKQDSCCSNPCCPAHHALSRRCFFLFFIFPAVPGKIPVLSELVIVWGIFPPGCIFTGRMVLLRFCFSAPGLICAASLLQLLGRSPVYLSFLSFILIHLLSIFFFVHNECSFRTLPFDGSIIRKRIV